MSCKKIVKRYPSCILNFLEEYANDSGQLSLQAGSLYRGMKDMLGWRIPCWGASCALRCFAATLDPSAKCPQQQPPPLGRPSKCLQTSPGAPRSHICPQVRTTALRSEAGGRILLFISPTLNYILFFLFLSLILP